jgi:5'-nucleotidase
VGIAGVTTEETPYTTMAANFEGLAMVPLVEAITGQARALRERGAQIVIVSAHAGGHCAAFDVPDQTESCAQDAEIFRVARDLERGLVDVIVAGHSHRGIAHRVNGIAIIESFAYGRAFGRVDLTVNRTSGEVSSVHIFPPQNLCDDGATCTYEGAPVAADAKLAALLKPAFEQARAVRYEHLGVTVVSAVKPAYGEESALGNLFTDLMLAARPDANIALTNGGGLRAELPTGELIYGQLYEAMPFDNRFATVRLTGADFARLIARNLGGTHGVFSLAGATARASCDGDSLRVELFRTDGTAIADTDELVVVTSDFLASGGDGAFGHLGLPEGAIRLDNGPTIRDAMADVLRQRKGELRGDSLVDRDLPRLTYAGDRPVRCR